MFFLFLPQKAAVLVQLEAVAPGAVVAGDRARMGQEAEIQCGCGAHAVGSAETFGPFLLAVAENELVVNEPGWTRWDTIF